MPTRTAVDQAVTAWGEQEYARGKADGRVQGQADRQPDVDAATTRAVAAEQALADHLATHEPSPYDLLTLSTEEQIRTRLRIPATAQLVWWGDVAKPGDMLGAVLDRLTAKQVLVLPQRDTPYLLDARDGFYASGASHVQLADGTRQAVKSKSDRWFSLARAKAGIVGLGRGTRIAVAPTDWRSPAQPRPTSAGAPGRFWWRTDGTKANELVGAQEKLIECSQPGAYVGNLALETAPDLGGIAYHALTLNKGGTVERVTGTGAWRGFAKVPNGETGMVAVTGRYDLYGITADAAGVGSSPLMVNNSPGGTVDHALLLNAVMGMPTIWRSSGEHVWADVDSIGNESHGVNLEECLDGFRLTFTRGTLRPGGMHLGLDARGRATIELVDVDLADLGRRNGVALADGTLHVQGYGQSRANRERITITASRGGQALPVKLYT